MTEPDPIDCDDCRERLEEFALDELTGDMRDQVAEHLAGGCAICNRQLTEIVTDFAAMAHTLPQQSPPSHLERDLLRRIAAENKVSPAAPKRSTQRSLTRGLIAAAAVLAASLLGIAAWTTWQDARDRRSLAEFQAALQQRLAEADDSQRFASVPGLTFVALRGPAPQSPVQGYAVTDRVARQWHVYVFNLPPLLEGRAYQLWFVTDNGGYVSAGSVAPDAAGSITRILDLPSDLLRIAGLAISDEPAAGSNQPSGEHLYQANLP